MNASASEPRRARSVWREIRSVGQSPSAVRRSATGGGRHLARQPAVGHEHDAVRIAAADGSCMTITSVRPRRHRLPQQREHLAPGAQVQRAGRLVANTISGSPPAPLRSPRAAAARRRLGGTVSARPSRPTRRAPRGRPRDSRRPASREGSATFCAAVSAASRLNALKTKPTRSRRMRASARSLEPPRSSSPRERDPTGPIEPGRGLQQGRLAGAGRPHHGGERSRLEAERDTVQSPGRSRRRSRSRGRGIRRGAPGYV